MTTPISRKSFLRSLALLAIAPVVAARALVSKGSSVKRQPVAGELVTPQADWVYNKPLLSPEENRAFINGIGVKVPSNRFYTEDRDSIRREGYHPGHNAYHAYVGDWDGTFKIEPGCSNPAYILAHLVESDFKTTLGDSTDWVLSNDWGDLNWRALYDYGVYCDTLMADFETYHFDPTDNQPWGWDAYMPVNCQPRYQINTVIQTEAQRAALKEELRMRFLHWRASDERYRRSWPV